MTRRRRGCLILLIAAALLILIVLGGPFLVPIPPLADTVPPEELADADSRFAVVNGLKVHYKLAGQGRPAVVLLHGFAASTFSWREVMEPLARNHTVLAFDRLAFGLTERPLAWQGTNPYGAEAQAELTVALMDELGIDRAILVGNSAGGTVAALTALRSPDRVEALVLVDAAIYSGGGGPRWLQPLISLPQIDRLGPLFVRRIQTWGLDFGRSAWHDPSKLTPEIWEGYTRPLRASNWDVGLWEFTRASRPLDLDRRLGELRMPVVVITGDDDRIVPTEQSIQLARDIPGAKLAVLPGCGHVPQEECPTAFLEALYEGLGWER
jgi:pimeloyl-ACP methyl ester carboxylesterase